MHRGLDLPAWITAIATVVVASEAIFVWVQLRETRQARLSDATFKLMDRWDSDAMKQAQLAVAAVPDAASLTALFAAQYLTPTATVDLAPFLVELDFFEDVGVLVRLGALSFE